MWSRHEGRGADARSAATLDRGWRRPHAAEVIDRQRRGSVPGAADAGTDGPTWLNATLKGMSR